MLSSLIFLTAAATATVELPTDGIMTAPNVDCISKAVSPAESRNFFAMARSGKEEDAFSLAEKVASRCQKTHGWSAATTRAAFRVAIMNGWLLEEGLLDRIAERGDFRPFLDSYYVENVKPDGRHILEDVFLSGKMDRDLTAQGYPEDTESRELAYNYWEWRGALYDIEEEFRKAAPAKP